MNDLLVIAPFGLLVGLILGALGGGGAILTVPILVYLLGQSPTAATAGSLVIVSLISSVGVLSHHSRGNVRFKDGLLFGLFGVVGSLAGSKLSIAVPAVILMTAFGVLLLAVGTLMARRALTGASAPGEGDRRGVGAVVLAATAVGLLTGFFGVGGGFAVVPALVLVLGFPMPAAVGTSLVVIVVNSLVALGARVTGGVEIEWPLILVFSFFGALGSLLGGRIAARVDPRHLTAAFSVLLFVVAAYVLAMNVPQL
ncbi:hypothetical protein SAMN05421595_2994 [Austwickia chelonae]|uniref:Probable membrane transporter protein n=1 Tax=Austwickia chelonae NBRC 105200 TaxID=1184607 RepID=K6VQX0_9MICO|nr:sulfite exporter TauE/SafE family protein [Austwickia chelonae]GAB79134.1 hypothetical protein AUCHE_20_00050 [Austwickia chelonae NBRC 105200]SEW42553.1 hypothetical protein SAMN05421595_2994 [Austwickia chelonae]